jgi:hypothetical protein
MKEIRDKNQFFAGLLKALKKEVGSESSAVILEKSMEARKGVAIGLSYPPARARIFKLLMSPKIDSKEPIPPGCLASFGIFKQSMGARNRVGIELSYRRARARIVIVYRAQESIPPAFI